VIGESCDPRGIRIVATALSLAIMDAIAVTDIASASIAVLLSVVVRSNRPCCDVAGICTERKFNEQVALGEQCARVAD
jgi:hypothetical protein